jgi:hypothetical protein
MNRLAIYAAILIAVFAVGFGAGWQQKTQQTNAAVVKQVVKVTKTEARQEAQVEKQNDSDKLKILSLEDRLATALRDARGRGVPKPSQPGCVPQAQGDAGAREAAGADGGSAGGYEEAYRALREELLQSGATAEQLRLQVLSCQTQWPGR